jgi:hypothetical protein
MLALFLQVSMAPAISPSQVPVRIWIQVIILSLVVFWRIRAIIGRRDDAEMGSFAFRMVVIWPTLSAGFVIVYVVARFFALSHWPNPSSIAWTGGMLAYFLFVLLCLMGRRSGANDSLSS